MSTLSNLTDATVWPDAALVAAAAEIRAEQDRRTVLLMAEQVVRQQQSAYLDARDQSGSYDPDPANPTVRAWVQPAGAHDAYPRDRRTTHLAKTWVSLVDGNVWEPGVSGWREETAGGTPAAWVQPTGAHDAYPLDALVTHNGQVWRSTAAANVWEPGVYGWVVA